MPSGFASPDWENPQAGAPEVRSGLKVLIADDRTDTADTTAALIVAWGHTVEVAYDGAETLQRADAFQPDVFLLDIGMPKLDGYEVAQEIRRREPLHEATVIAVTAHGDEAHRQQSHDAGIDLHLVKPVDPWLLEKALALIQHTRKAIAHMKRAAIRNVDLRRQTALLIEELRKTIERPHL